MGKRKYTANEKGVSGWRKKKAISALDGEHEASAPELTARVSGAEWKHRCTNGGSSEDQADVHRHAMASTVRQETRFLRFCDLELPATQQ
jgi:hypothetical protein